MISLFGPWAGLLSIAWGERWHVHVAVRPSHWVWGHAWEEYDHCLEYWGLGPAFLVVRG